MNVEVSQPRPPLPSPRLNVFSLWDASGTPRYGSWDGSHLNNTQCLRPLGRWDGSQVG
ncbi:hypothetical protein SBV1_2360003 [Verrucomicrobia bacterium]|nr:hypothetical protein SBV1_2360003 [Verrucomicrobiota bacterium]